MTAVLARVSELAEQVRGVSYGKGDALDAPEEGYLPVLRAGNITDTGIVFDDFVFVPEALVSKKQLLRAGDVLIAASSGSLDVVGKAAPVLADFDGGFGAFCKVLRPNRELVDVRYFSHFFRTPEYRRIVSGLAAGANINNLRNEHLDDLLIPLPAIAEQRRIAAILDKADTLRTKRREVLAQLNRLARSIFVEMFGDEGSNPKGWPKIQIQALCKSPDDIKCGPFGTQLAKSEVEDEGVPLWGIKNVNAQFRLPAFEFLAPRTAHRLKAYGLTAGDIVMTRKGTVGNCAVYPDMLPDGVMHSDLLRIRTDPGVCLSDFLSHQLHHSRDVERQLALISGGAVMPGINVTKLKLLEVLLPPLRLQQEFSRRLSALRCLERRAELSQQLLGLTFQSLQHRAFRGEL